MTLAFTTVGTEKRVYDARDAMLERRLEPVRRDLLDRVKARVADRIRSVCGQLSDAEFDALVTRIAEIEIKYSTRRTEDLFNVEHAHPHPFNTLGASPPPEKAKQQRQ